MFPFCGWETLRTEKGRICSVNLLASKRHAREGDRAGGSFIGVACSGNKASGLGS